MRKMQLSELVLDFDIYPRADVDSHHISSLAEAIAAGAELPPIVIDKQSKRIVDGFHRFRAYQKMKLDVIEVIEKQYQDDKALFLDTMRYNSAHGVKLDTHDKAHCAILAERLSIDANALSAALNITTDTLSSIKVGRTAKDENSMLIPIKRTIAHMSGEKLTKEQEKANEKLSGMNQSFYANQLITLIENHMIDYKNRKLLARLGILSRLIDNLLTNVV